MAWRDRMWSRLRAARVRARTVACGVALGGVLLVALALVGGVDPVPPGPDRQAPGHPGPLTAIQPELRRALLTDEDLAGHRPDAPAPAGTTAVATTPAVPTVAPAPEETGLAELCHLLLEDPAGLAALWRATPPEETTAHHTRREGGAVLDQMLSVFKIGQAPEAYRRLREAATSCDRFTTTLADGTPVRVLLRELARDRRESSAAGGLFPPTPDAAYLVRVTVEGLDPAGMIGTRELGAEDAALTGWLALDRLGPVVSVLRHRGPAGPAAGDPAEIRTTALDKLRPLLHVLRR